MEKFYLEEPSLKRKNEAIEFINTNVNDNIKKYSRKYEDKIEIKRQNN